MGDLRKIVNSFKTFDDMYYLLNDGDYTFLNRECGTNNYPEIRWMIEYFTDIEEYEKCEFLSKLELPQPTKEELNKEIERLRLHITK